MFCHISLQASEIVRKANASIGRNIDAINEPLEIKELLPAFKMKRT
jgi:hypothetical protein